MDLNFIGIRFKSYKFKKMGLKVFNKKKLLKNRLENLKSLKN